MGEKDKSKRCCIYCGNKGEKNFIEKAHAIPEALGNEVIQNEECDNVILILLRILKRILQIFSHSQELFME